MNRLKEYEDTGLTPDEVSELAQAKEDGSIVVLPCKRGDIVYFIKSAFSLTAFPIEAKVVSIHGINCDNEIMYTSVTTYNNLDRYFTSEDIGKTVFLTKAEAQFVLEKLKGNEDE